MGNKGIFVCLFVLAAVFATLGYYVSMAPHPASTAAPTQPAGESQHLFAVPHNNRWGFMDRSGRVVIRPQFQMVSEFHEGLAAVQTGNHWGFIDEKGKMIIPAKFYNVADFHEGLCAVVVDPKVAEYPGFVDRTGSFAIRVDDAQYLGQFSEGMAVISLGGKFGYLDKKGNLAITPQFDVATEFSEGIARVATKTGETYKWGYIDKFGNVIIPIQFDEAGDFSEGTAGVRIGAVAGFIDRSGAFTILPQYEYAGDFKEGLAPVVQVKFGYVDKSGTMVIPPDFDLAHSFSEGLARVEVAHETGPLVGFIDKEGRVVIEPQFDNAMNFSGGLAIVNTKEHIGYIDQAGNFVWKPCFSCNIPE